jgi:tagatose 1,6-diphosphate aldolase GatY/KbaY
MLLTGTEALHLAAKQGWALPAFAVYNLEMVQAIVTAAEEADRPVLLLAGSSHFHHAGQTALMNIALTAARSTSASVGVHLDHCRDLPEMQRCLDAGYSSVMIDGSHLSFEANIRLTREAATLAHEAGAWIEAELGAVPGDEDVSTNALPSQTMTDSLQAREFVERTEVDALAVAVGNVHGFTASPVTSIWNTSTPLPRSARFRWSCTARADCHPTIFEAPSPVESPKSTSTQNYAAHTSSPSNVHCRRQCRTLTLSLSGGRDGLP